MEQSSISEKQTSPCGVGDENDSHTLTLSVSGIHCASCIQLIEKALHAEDDVISARVNMSTKRLTFSWNGEKTRGDELAAIVSKLGYSVKSFDDSKSQNESYERERTLLKCIAVSGFAAGNIMLLSVGLWSSTQEIMGIATRDFLHLLSGLIAIPAVFYSGRPFFYSAISVLKERRTNMDVPISIAVILACAMSVLETFNHGEHVYFDSAVMLLFFLLIGRYLDARAKGKACAAAEELLSMMTGSATLLEDGKQRIIQMNEIREGMILLVAAGENIPADGVVISGISEVDTSLITGETLPRSITKSNTVFAGTTNISAPIKIEVSKASEKSLLSEIIRLMEKAEQGQSHYVRLADKAASLYTPVVHTMGLFTFLGWFFIMGEAWQPSLLYAITVLIITCPCALGLAVPVVQVLASGKLMKRGILLKSADALEKLSKIDTIVFDKTGTLTLGKPELLGNDYSDTDLKLAASLASKSKHPLSIAITNVYQGDIYDLEITEIPGSGLEAVHDGKTVRLGKRSWCGDMDGHLSQEEGGQEESLEMWLSLDGEKPVQFAFSDKLRSDAKGVIGEIKEYGLGTLLLSGDREEVVSAVSSEVGITEYHAAMSPVEKCEYLEELHRDRTNTLMVGDGLNDAPALATASVSISPSTAMDIAQNAADIVFQGEKLDPVLTSWKTAKTATKLVKQNFILAVCYNIIAIPLAVMGYVTPLIAAAAMSGSSLIVIMNSFRLNIDGKKNESLL